MALRWLPLLAAVSLAAPVIEATPIMFATPPDASVSSGRAVSAVALFDIDAAAHRITVSLLNLQTDPTDVTQLISGMAFSLTNLSSGRLSGSLESSSAPAFSIGRDGEPTAPTVTTTDWVVEPVTSGRIVGVPNGSSLYLCKVCQWKTVNGADELLIGGPGANGEYNNANGSIAGNNPHNPFLLAAWSDYIPVFGITIPQITMQTTVSNVTFTFGTKFGDAQAQAELAGMSDPVPEPGVPAMLLTGLALVVVRGRSTSAR